MNRKRQMSDGKGPAKLDGTVACQPVVDQNTTTEGHHFVLCDTKKTL